MKFKKSKLMKKDLIVNENSKEIYLAGGCFWGTEKYFAQIDGVLQTEAGYANGNTENPTYEDVCHKNSGHAEAVKIIYNPEKVSLGFILQLFYDVIDPLAKNRQGNDIGAQYRTGIYYTDIADIKIIEDSLQELQKLYTKPLAIEVMPLKNYAAAEDYHQDYLDKNPGGYCHIGKDKFREAKSAKDPKFKYQAKSKEFLKETLTKTQYDATQNNATEAPFENEYNANSREGIYVDINTGEPLVSSNDKFEAGCGWNLENSYAQLPKIFFSHLSPKKVPSPELVILNHQLAESLGLNVKELESKEGIEIFSGNKVPRGSKPIAQAYAGHQFGHFTMLGDGRALLIGEQVTPEGEKFDIQLKGSGITPYSRRGDGRASLGPMLREYIISEAMHGLAIPTTRSLAVVTTGEPVIRQSKEIGAILTRVASSHVRVGTFQYAANKASKEDVQALADYTLERHFSGADMGENKYLFLLQEVIKRQAALIAKWQLVGFIHGVMNTDNMSLAGETIDYGPCAFMNSYDPNTVFSSIDRQGRYSYGNQPKIAAWNIARFAETLLVLLNEDQDKAIKIGQEEIAVFFNLYNYNFLQGMRAKLGIFNEEVNDDSLISQLLNMMQKYEADFTNTFKSLSLGKHEETALFASSEFTKWYELWQARLEGQEQSLEEAKLLMKKNNPALIPRNHRVEEALEAAVEKNDLSVFENLLAALKDPFAYSQEQEKYSTPPEDTDLPYQTFCGT